MGAIPPPGRPSFAEIQALTTVFVDAENVRRSAWPNVAAARLVDLCDAWAREHGVHAVVVFDGAAPRAEGADVTVVGTGPESADDWIARSVLETAHFWLVTSDRELRERVGNAGDRTIGGGSFLRQLAR